MNEKAFHDLWPFVTSLATVLGLLVLRGLVFRALRERQRLHAGGPAAIFLQVFRLPSLLWCVAIAIHVAIGRTDLPREVVEDVQLGITLLIVFSVCLASASALESLTREGLGSVDRVLAQSGLLKGLIRTLVFAAGGLVVLAKVGIQIGPMLTALGVGGLAVGLALQNTLSNLFAGVTLIIDRSFGVGDRVKLASGDTGRISDVGWRTVMVTLDSGDTLIIPNGKIAQENVVRLKI